MGTTYTLTVDGKTTVYENVEELVLTASADGEAPTPTPEPEPAPEPKPEPSPEPDEDDAPTLGGPQSLPDYYDPKVEPVGKLHLSIHHDKDLRVLSRTNGGNARQRMKHRIQVPEDKYDSWGIAVCRDGDEPIGRDDLLFLMPQEAYIARVVRQGSRDYMVEKAPSHVKYATGQYDCMVKLVRAGGRKYRLYAWAKKQGEPNVLWLSEVRPGAWTSDLSENPNDKDNADDFLIGPCVNL